MVAERGLRDGRARAETEWSACGALKHEADIGDDRRTVRGCLHGENCRASYEKWPWSQAENELCRVRWTGLLWFLSQRLFHEMRSNGGLRSVSPRF